MDKEGGKGEKMGPVTLEMIKFYWNKLMDRMEEAQGEVVTKGRALVAQDEEKLLLGLAELIWDPELLNAKPNTLERVYEQIHLDLDLYLYNYERTSDEKDLLQFSPISILFEAMVRSLLAFLLGGWSNAQRALGTLEELLGTYSSKFNPNPAIESAFLFSGRIIEHLNIRFSNGATELVTFKGESPPSLIPSFNELGDDVKSILRLCKSLFLKMFHYKGQERMILLRELTKTSENVEVYIEALDTFRRRRLDLDSRQQQPHPVEFEWLDKAHSLADDNPFMKLMLCDYIIDCLRVFKKAFWVGGILYGNDEKTVENLRKICRNLVQEYPNSVKINSRISDYFARFTPRRYFDFQFAEECLRRAHDLCPTYPKTNHRMGIFLRMCKMDLEGSLQYFRAAMEYDPSHANATLEYFKTLMRDVGDRDIPQMMSEKIEKGHLKLWSELEKGEYNLLHGLAAFAKGDKEGCLRIWTPVINNDVSLLPFKDLDWNAGIFSWDLSLIGSDPIRLWIDGERKRLRAAKSKGEPFDAERKRLFEILYDFAVFGKTPAVNSNGSSTGNYIGPFVEGHVKYKEKQMKDFQEMNTLP